MAPPLNLPVEISARRRLAPGCAFSSTDYSEKAGFFFFRMWLVE